MAQELTKSGKGSHDRAAKIAKRKKKWFTVIAPEIFNSKEIAEVPAFEPDDLINRPVEVNMMQLTGVHKDQQRKVIFKITKVQGEKAFTDPLKYYLIYGYVQRSSRKFKEKFISVLKIKTKDDRMVKVKFNVLVKKKLHQKTRAHTMKELESKAVEKISGIESANLFVPANLSKLTAEIKEDIRHICPAELQIWKLTLI